MKIWLLMQPCEDSYYPGHPTGQAFANQEDAMRALAKENAIFYKGPIDEDEESYSFYLKEVQLHV